MNRKEGFEPLNSAKSAIAGGPRHFHLLWDEDIEQLRGIFRLIMDHSEDVVRHWYKLYVLHFGDSRSLSESEFTRIFEPGLRRNKEALLAGDMDLYAAQVIRLGELLAERRVPLEEIIASLHLFEESAQTVFPQDSATHIYTSFDKLSHVRIILLVSAYFRSNSAAAGERILALEREAARLSHGSRTRFRGLVGGSPAMRRLYGRIETAAATREGVLIAGEKGAGKELVARAIHESTAGPHQPFVAIKCSAVPADFIASEMFGYTRQALNGAAADYLGLIRSAEGGTVFIDEICALGSDLQRELLRIALQGTVCPIGSSERFPVNFRLIASTESDPEAAVKRGQLRADLFKRLRNCLVKVPPLRDRRGDIPLLVEHFISVFRERSGRMVYGISEKALDALQIFPWPGNVRELAQVVEESFLSSSHSITLADLPSLAGHKDALREARAPQPLGKQPNVASFRDLERDLIQRALESMNGDRAQAARLLNISQQKLNSKLKKLGLKPHPPAAPRSKH